MRHWEAFTCTWTVFDRKGAVDRDVTFEVHPRGATGFELSNARFGYA